MRCDVIAQGIVAAAEQLSLKVPIVVRLQGKLLHKSQTNVWSVLLILTWREENYREARLRYVKECFIRCLTIFWTVG